MISSVTLSPISRHKVSFRPGTMVITNASGDLHRYSGSGVEIFQPFMVRPSNATCSRDSESNSARARSTLDAAFGLYSLTTRVV